MDLPFDFPGFDISSLEMEAELRARYIPDRQDDHSSRCCRPLWMRISLGTRQQSRSKFIISEIDEGITNGLPDKIFKYSDDVLSLLGSCP